MEPVLTFERLEDAGRCWLKLLQGMRRRRGVITPDERKAMEVGKIVENAIASEDEDREQLIEEQIANLPPERQAEVKQRVETLLERADELVEEEEGEAEDLVQFRWLDPVNGWTYVAKPDRVRYTQSENGTGVQQVIDDKTGGVWRARYKRLIFYFLLVVSLCNQANNEKWPLQGVINLLGKRRREDGTQETPEPRVFRYSKAREPQQLSSVRRVVSDIDKRTKQNLELSPSGEGNVVVHPVTGKELGGYRKGEKMDNGRHAPSGFPIVNKATGERVGTVDPAFPPKEGWDCYRCRHRNICPLWLTKTSQAVPKPAVPNPENAPGGKLPIVA